MTLHLELPLAPPLHSIHIGTEQYADTSLRTVGPPVLFLISFSSLPFFPLNILPLPLIPSFAQPLRGSGRLQFMVNLQGLR